MHSRIEQGAVVERRVLEKFIDRQTSWTSQTQREKDKTSLGHTYDRTRCSESRSAGTEESWESTQDTDIFNPEKHAEDMREQ